MDLTVLNLAVPALSADLKPSAAQLLWIIDIYGFMVAGFLIPMGTLGDRIGRRRLLLIGAVAFGVASVLAAFSRSAETLIVMRALLGIAGATLAPSTLSLIRNMFHDPVERTTAIGIWITSFSVGGAIGPLIGGVLLQYFWWGSVFLVAVPVMVLLLVVGPTLLPEFRDPTAGRPDLWSALLSLAAVLSMIYGIKWIAQRGLAWQPVVAILAGLAIGTLFVRRQRRLADPLIDLRLFRSRAFSTSIAITAVTTLVAFGAFIFTSQCMQLVLELSPLQAGLWSVPMMAAFIVGSNLVPPMMRWVRREHLLSGGLLIAAIGFAALALVDQSSGPLLLVVASVVYCLGLAPVFTLTTDLIVGAAPPERAGAASALSETGSEFGGALGIAILGSIGTAMYRMTMSDQAIPGLAPQALDAARGTLGAATAIAQTLAEPMHGELLTASRSAFMQSFKLVVLTCAVLSLATAALAALMLPRTQTTARRHSAVGDTQE